MNRRFLLALAGAALFGLLAILITQRILTTKVSQQNVNSYSNIVLARTRIPINTVITADMVATSPYLKVNLPDGAQNDVKLVVGKTAISDIEVNFPVTARNTVGSNSSILSSTISKEMRGISIRVDEASGVAGFATPGSYVDVIAIMNPGNGSRTVSKTIVQNLRVIAVGPSTQARPENGQARGNTVTLEATTAQTEALTLAMREGTLHLVLRNAGDKDLHPSKGVDSTNLVDEIPMGKPSPSPKQMVRIARDLPPVNRMQTPSPDKMGSPEKVLETKDSHVLQYTVYEGTTEKKVPVKQ